MTKVSAVQLDTDHRDAFSRAVRTILASDLAETTMAQLVDGLPQADIAWEARGNFLTRAHPLADHEQLCEGAREKTRLLREEFNPDTLSFESYLLQAYSHAEMDSVEFKMRLIEMVAVSIHQIAVAIFDSVPKTHTPAHIKFVTEWQPPSGWVEYYGRRTWEEPPFPPPPTHFFHCAYSDFDLYPNGVADVAGYWAEDRILGGVVVFDRGQNGTECKDIFLHSGRSEETFRVWRLLKSQLALLVNFLLGKTPLEGFSLPLTATDENLYRFDPWDAIALYHVFRDPWERRIPLQKPPERDVRSVGDYPELGALFKNINEAIQRADNHDDEVVVDDSANETSSEEQRTVPTKPDRLWIYRHGGHMGEPLASRRLPWIGPPEDVDKAERFAQNDGSDDSDCSMTTFGHGFRTPSPFESVQPDEEALPREWSEPPMGKKLEQEVGVTGKNSTRDSRANGDVERNDEQYDLVKTFGKSGEGAEDVGMETGDIANRTSTGSATGWQP